eukprot:13364713-Ditylum_brightwellii.AAC.1
MVTKRDTPLELHVTFGNDLFARALKQRNPIESMWQLGVKNNPAGNPADDENVRREKSITIASRLTRSSILPKNAFQLYRNI